MPDTRVLPKISCVSFSCPCRVKLTWWICTNYVCLSLQLLNLLIVFTVLISFLFHYLVWPRSLHLTHFELQITAAKKQTLLLWVFHIISKSIKKCTFFRTLTTLIPSAALLAQCIYNYFWVFLLVFPTQYCGCIFSSSFRIHWGCKGRST